MKSTWGPRLVKGGVGLAVLGVLLWVFGTSANECRVGDRFDPCGTGFVGLLLVFVTPGVAFAAVGGVLVKRGYDREERERIARERERADTSRHPCTHRMHQ